VSSGTLKVYVPLEDAGMLPEAERRIRQQTFEALQEAGVTAPDIETDAAPGGVIDESEEVLGWPPGSTRPSNPMGVEQPRRRRYLRRGGVALGPSFLRSCRSSCVRSAHT
jgi:hypothetical protein